MKAETQNTEDSEQAKSAKDAVKQLHMYSDLPQEITKHLPGGYQPTQGVWFVLPELDVQHDGIATVNSWMRAQDWYPYSLKEVIWYGDDGVGNLFGWRPKSAQAILWNPEDGDRPFKEGTIQELWDFVLRGYDDVA